jgi:hypothetical protein
MTLLRSAGSGLLPRPARFWAKSVVFAQNPATCGGRVRPCTDYGVGSLRLLSLRAVKTGAAAAALFWGVASVALGQSAPVTGGRVIAKGPGYSIVATSPGAGKQAAAAARAKVTDAPLETLHEPIVCRGKRVLSIDDRNIRFAGNAVTAEDGCDLHIINSRISAGGIAIRARNATVHIENSEIDGRKASLDASDGAQVYAETSTFKGAARRLGRAAIHDLGNNDWL